MARKRMVLELGMGTDLGGEDYTKAAIRALRDALWHNSLTIADAMGVDRQAMEVDILIGTGKPDEVDETAVAAILPYGTARVRAVQGGMDIPKEDGSLTVMANAAVVVWLDLPEASA
ncbi:MAG: Lin0512 family protein [Pseudomonadota bacterium]